MNSEQRDSAASPAVPVAQDERAAGPLTEDELHAHDWWCPTCKKDVPPEMVTKDGEHYLEAGGCGYAVRGELIEDQPKQPLSDDEIHRIWMETPERPTLAEEVLAFGRTLLARAGIGAVDKAAEMQGRKVDKQADLQGRAGITPQAGKESGG